MTDQAEIMSLRQLSARIGSDPLLTQGSTGNISMKLDDLLWIKASGKWMAGAIQEDIFVPLNLAKIRELVKQGVDPAERYQRASIETAMHAVLPHRIVLHVHCVNTIAWAVRQDARNQLQHKLEELPWQWIPYVPSGLPLAQEIEKALSIAPYTDVLILGNHGLVIGGDDCDAVERLLSQVIGRLVLCPRQPQPADYAALSELADGPRWDLADDPEVHALGTDSVSRKVLSGGLLYPCQAIFSSPNPLALFEAIPYPALGNLRENRYSTRPFLIIEGCGVIVSRTMTLVERQTISGLAQVVQRINSSSALRYLTEGEIKDSYSVVASRYRENAG